ncbi:hypothetical protein CEP52_007500 [Fusarium oligoseptatum]|uniref:CFEM domain-containing protein n=1 Tax=Fusarium oligoseptatum TaxID=2604345 RepID=A0A428TM75_9HYPO|nr:hypothetical protein CEP52_007500 [Fusarium oligoseptatum]
MKATLFLAAAGLVAAQDFTGQPECAIKCLEEYVPKAGCDLEDTACQCDPAFQEKITPQISPCLMKECDAADLPKALAAAQAACEAYASASGKSSGSVTGTVTATAPETESETETETASEEETETETDEMTGTVTASVDTSITGSVTLPAIFSTTTDLPATPGPSNKTTTKTGGSGNDDEETGTGSGSETSATGTAAETGNAAAVTGPAFGGFLAILAAFFAL